MSDSSNSETSRRDEEFLRRCFEVARRSMAHGNHPFGAILVDERGPDTFIEIVTIEEAACEAVVDL